MINIIITLDYELFGNGAGSVKNHMLIPTQKIFEIFDKHDVNITIMFEVCEYLKFCEYDSIIRNDLGYSPASEIREQVVNAVKRGHDVQLHFHPQWIDAVYENKRWIMSNPRHSMKDLSQLEIAELIKTGKNELEKLIKPVNSKYLCCAMRLTNLPLDASWAEAPPEVVLPMRNNGIRAHSLSVSTSPRNNQKGYWQLDSENRAVEIPIHSIEMPVMYMLLNIHRLRTVLYLWKFSHGQKSRKNNESSAFRLKRIRQLFLDKHSFKWDFCKQSAQEMLKFLEYGMRRYDHVRYEVPLIMISHSKDFFNEKHLERFLFTVNKHYIRRGQVRFSTLQGFIRRCLTN